MARSSFFRQLSRCLVLCFLLFSSPRICPQTFSSPAQANSDKGDITANLAQQICLRTALSDGSENRNSINSIRGRTLNGLAAGEEFGEAVANAGDVNGDGFDDIIVGAPFNDAGGQDAGRAYIFFGGKNPDTFVDLILTGEAPGDQLGRSVARAGDVNGDGFSDVIVGADLNDAGGQGAGRAYIYFGGPNVDNVADVVLTGEAASDRLGFTVSSAGDVNGDGFSDVIVGAPLSDRAGANAGQAYLYFGSTQMDTVVDVRLTGVSAGQIFGSAVADAGDVNHDGFGDVLIGTFGNISGQPNTGRAYIYFGNVQMDSLIDVTLTGEAAFDGFGTTVSGAGDVNGDGFSDILVGANGNDAGGNDAGRAYIYLGSTAMDSIPDVTLTGLATGDLFGISVSAAGDIDGDGFGDVIVGAERNDAGGPDAGRAYVYFGSDNMDESADIILTGEVHSENFGSAVAGGADIDGDGHDDLLVGANLNNFAGPRTGRAYLYFNSLTGTDIADERFSGQAAQDSFGISVGSAGDIDGDGYDDILVGAESNDANGINAGRAYLFFGGTDLDPFPDVTFNGEAARDRFGGAVSSGDVNGDGFPDVVVGARKNDAGGPDAGRAYVFWGGPGMDAIADVILTGGNPDARLGSSVAVAGDVNGDGFGDIIVGAPATDALGAGSAFVYFGGTNMDSLADLTLSGEVAGDKFGETVASAGDVNGDGYGDFIVGAPENDAAGTNAGKVYLYFGSASVDNVADMTYSGAMPGDGFGACVASAGDINGDAFGDILVGAPQTDGTRGSAFIYLGGLFLNDIPAITLMGEAENDFFGESVTGAGDVNADGFDDLLVGAPGNDRTGRNAGRAYLYFGGAVKEDAPDIILSGKDAGGGFGRALASAGDVNGDGRSDVIIGAPDSLGRASLYLSSSPTIIPQITSVLDIPHDQGGKVRLQWLRSGYDIPEIAKVTDYIIQRSEPPGLAGFVWDYVTTIPAFQQPLYSFVTPTLFDSSANTNGIFFFRIIARTSDPLESWTSAPFSGHSVDNLPPQPVSFLHAEWLHKTSVQLSWRRNLSDPDVDHYTVYRSEVKDFLPQPEFELATTEDTTYIDRSPSMDGKGGQTLYYRIVTFDKNGNSSPPSPQAAMEFNVEQTAPIPTAFNLYQNYPNPFNPETKIRFDIPGNEKSHVRLAIYNLVGQLVAVLLDENQAPGRHVITWHGESPQGHPVPSGLYIYKLDAGEFSATKKLLLVR